MVIFYVFSFIIFLYNIVTGLNVSEFNQMYELLGWPLIDPTTCLTHRASQEIQTSRVACVGF